MIYIAYVYSVTFNVCAKQCMYAVMLISFCLSCRYFEQNDLADQPEWTAEWLIPRRHWGISRVTDAAFRQQALHSSKNLWTIEWWRLFTNQVKSVERTKPQWWFCRSQKKLRTEPKGLDHELTTCIISSNVCWLKWTGAKSVRPLSVWICEFTDLSNARFCLLNCNDL